MGDDTKTYELDSGKTISSLDDVPEIAKIAKRQLFLINGIDQSHWRRFCWR
jgi:hypothetical protein